MNLFTFTFFQKNSTARAVPAFGKISAFTYGKVEKLHMRMKQLLFKHNSLGISRKHVSIFVLCKCVDCEANEATSLQRLKSMKQSLFEIMRAGAWFCVMQYILKWSLHINMCNQQWNWETMGVCRRLNLEARFHVYASIMYM
jgi:hypothetical protein